MRILNFLQACVLSDSCAVMALDSRGHVAFATDKLAAMLGYPVSTLVKMDLSTLLPQPYCHMHGAWFKVTVSLSPWLTQRPGLYG